MSKVRVIKKYPNRRLYDTEVSSYITLEDVRHLVVDGVEFKVVDAKTQEEITRSVMLQIIAEYEERGQPIFTTSMLARIIRFYGDALQGFMSSYLDKSLELFTNQQRQLRKQFDSFMDQAPWEMMTDLTERNLELWRQFQSGLFSEREPAEQAQSDDTAGHEDN